MCDRLVTVLGDRVRRKDGTGSLSCYNSSASVQIVYSRWKKQVFELVNGYPCTVREAPEQKNEESSRGAKADPESSRACIFEATVGQDREHLESSGRLRNLAGSTLETAWPMAPPVTSTESVV